MQLLSSGDSAEDDTGHAGVAGEGESLFEGDHGKQEEVSEEVGAKDKGGEVGRDKSEEEVRCWVVVVRYKRVGRGDGVEICSVAPAEEVW